MNKRILLLSVLFVSFFLYSGLAQDLGIQDISSDLKPYVKPNQPVNEAIWDVQFNYDATAVTLAAGNAGAVYIPTLDKFWTSRWATGVLHQWNSNGTLDLEFTLPFTGTRGMAFDGTFLYHSINTTTVQIVDPVTRTPVGTIPVVGAPNGFRFITYNPDGNAGAGSIIGGNWTSPNLNFYEFSMTGTLLRTITNTVTGVYGIAYDNVSPGGPFLWVWGQGSGAGFPQIIQQMDYTSGLYTGVQHDVVTDVGLGNASAIAGGLFITTDLVPGFATLGGLLQGTPDRLFGYELTPTGPPCPIDPPTNPNPANGATDVPIGLANLTWTNGAGATSMAVLFGETGNLDTVYTGPVISSLPMPVALQYLTSYSWRVIGSNDTCQVSGPTWSFTTVQAGPGVATNPTPSNGATNVSVDVDLSWTNPGGATSLEVFFGTNPGSLTSVYSGAPISTFDPGTLQFYTQYYWRVDEIDATGTTPGEVWNFRTEFAPGVNILGANPGPANNGGSATWAMFFDLIANQDYSIEVFQMTTASAAAANVSFSVEFFTRSGSALGGPVGSGPGSSSAGWTSIGTVPVTQGSTASGISLPFATPLISINPGDTVGVAMRFNTVGPRYYGTGTPPYGNYSNASLRIITGDVRSAPFTTTGSFFTSRELVGEIYYNATIIPVELASFTASAGINSVTLKWSTASETNNNGFEVQRRSGEGFVSVGFVSGKGTTTEVQNYTYVDNQLVPGTYTYRLKQVDYDGTFEYSNEIEVDVLAPKEFALNQNFPNPFNPNTMITFSLAVDAKVTLKVFDILGQEVMTLVNSNLSSGAHEYNFDASNFNSGVYFYRIEAAGVDGRNFTSVKKMILTK